MWKEESAQAFRQFSGEMTESREAGLLFNCLKDPPVIIGVAAYDQSGTECELCFQLEKHRVQQSPTSQGQKALLQMFASRALMPAFLGPVRTELNLA